MARARRMSRGQAAAEADNEAKATGDPSDSEVELSQVSNADAGDRDFSAMKVKELQAILADYGLDTKGRKSDLVERILEHQAASEAPSTPVKQAAKPERSTPKRGRAGKSNDVEQEASDQEDTSMKTRTPIKKSAAAKAASPKLVARTPAKRGRAKAQAPSSPVEEAADRSPSPAKVSSPAKDRSPSPSKIASPVKDRSPSPANVSSPARSVSPAKSRSPSPTKRKSPSPEQRRSPSPLKDRSPSPTPMRSSRRDAIRSPVKKLVASRSPLKDRSPEGVASMDRSPSPVKVAARGRSRSPLKSASRSPSPINKKRSSSPDRMRASPLSPTMELSTGRRAPSPMRDQSPVRRSASPAVNRKRKEVPSSPSSPAQTSKMKDLKTRHTTSSTCSVRIDNFVRPLRVEAVRELCTSYGTVEFLWMDKIKSHAMVKFASIDEAEAALNALDGMQFQPESSKTLAVSVIDNSVVDQLSGGSASNAVADSNGSKPLQPETTTVTLDSLFKKTKSLPPLYWLPVDAAEVEKRKQSRGYRPAMIRPGGYYRR